MNIQDVSPKWLLKVARFALTKRNGEVFAGVVVNSQGTTDELQEMAKALYANNANVFNLELELNPGDLSVFVYLLMALAMINGRHQINSLKDCDYSLSQCLNGYENISGPSKTRMCKCLWEAVELINNDHDS